MTDQPAGIGQIDVAILAGGLGTRIRGVLGDTPKVLAPIHCNGGARPFLDILLNWLSREGVRRVVLCLGHLADRVIDHLRAVPRSDLLAISSIVEPRPLGTAGALRFAAAHLTSDPVMVVNGDTLVDADLGSLLAHHHASGAAATMLCVRVADAGRYGRVAIDDRGRIIRFIEKDPGAGAGVINAGIYLLGRATMAQIAAGRGGSIERDFLETAPSGTIATVVTVGRFIDIGTPESLDAAQQVLAGPT